MITYPNAVDENGDVHNIGSITKENRAEHKYYCLGCDKEMVPVLFKDGQKEDHFRHKVNDMCNPETYLHNLAKKYLAKKFEESKVFEVSYYVQNECPLTESCKIYEKHHNVECSGIRKHTVDLKKLYDTCQIEGVYDGYRADVLLTSSTDSGIKPVFIEVSVSHDCTPEKIASGNQIIEIKVRSEADFKRPLVENKGDYVPQKKKEENNRQYYRYGYYSIAEPEPAFIMFHGFERVVHESDIYKIDYFSLKSTGRMAYQENFLKCGMLEKFHIPDGIFEVYRLNGHRGYQPRYDFFNLGVAEAMINKQPLRHCVFCSKFARCTIPMEYEVYDRYTREKKKVIRQVLNRGVKEDKIDKYDLAKACKNWQLNEAKCQQVISEHRFSEIYTWASDPDDLPE